MRPIMCVLPEVSTPDRKVRDTIPRPISYLARVPGVYTVDRLLFELSKHFRGGGKVNALNGFLWVLHLC